jgi:hypothetical protein
MFSPFFFSIIYRYKSKLQIKGITLGAERRGEAARRLRLQEP